MAVPIQTKNVITAIEINMILVKKMAVFTDLPEQKLQKFGIKIIKPEIKQIMPVSKNKIPLKVLRM